MIYEICIFFLLFIIYSVIGWLIEVTLVSYNSGEFVNRGFLIGPYCPIYGVGCLSLLFLLQKYINDVMVLFVMAALICSFIEYMTSYIMEKVFKARWWDYSDKKFNVNGRICLVNSVYFGILGCVLIYAINPAIEPLIRTIPLVVTFVLSGVVFILFMIDFIVTTNVVTSLKRVAYEAKKDNTVEITKKVKEIVAEKSALGRRLLNAFPDFTSTLKSKQQELNEKAEQLKTRILEEIEEQKTKFSERSQKFRLKK